MLRTAFKFLGFTRNAETDDITVDPDVPKTAKPDGEEQQTISTNKSEIKGEIDPEDEGPIDDE